MRSLAFASFLFVLLVLISNLNLAQTSNYPTFHLDVAPIIYNNCTECHRVGELGPMPLTTYDEVAANGYYIEYVTQSGYMPPWTPDHNYTTLIGERFLTEDEKQTLVDWVASDMPEGNPSDNPGMPDFDIGLPLGNPDLVLTMSEP